MNILYRLAQASDAQAVQQIKQQVWPEEDSTLDQIQSALSAPDHICYLAEINGLVAGFMACFPTTSVQQTLRLEMDLLVVLPHYQGQGIASTLIDKCLHHRFTRKAQITRTLIQVNNIASQKAFQHNGFVLQPEMLTLFVKSGQGLETPFEHIGFSGDLIPVQTINYSGYWLEPPFKTTPISLPQPFQTVGALLPGNNGLQQAAIQQGYEKINQYQWWVLPAKEN